MAILVDPEDRKRVAAHTWHVDSMGYLASRINGRLMRLHRFVMGLEPGDGKVVDHLNHDKLDNRKANLHVGTQMDNAQNVSPHRDAACPYRGVSYSRSNKGWIAQRQVRGRRVHLGTFPTPELADQALKEAFGG